jgi:hypothetical protein
MENENIYRADWEMYAADCAKKLAGCQTQEELTEQLSTIDNDIYLRLVSHFHPRFYQILHDEYVAADGPGDDLRGTAMPLLKERTERPIR